MSDGMGGFLLVILGDRQTETDGHSQEDYFPIAARSSCLPSLRFLSLTFFRFVNVFASFSLCPQVVQLNLSNTLVPCLVVHKL